MAVQPLIESTVHSIKRCKDNYMLITTYIFDFVSHAINPICVKYSIQY